MLILSQDIESVYLMRVTNFTRNDQAKGNNWIEKIKLGFVGEDLEAESQLLDPNEEEEEKSEQKEEWVDPLHSWHIDTILVSHSSMWTNALDGGTMSNEG